jgi:hypothetical protein
MTVPASLCRADATCADSRRTSPSILKTGERPWNFKASTKVFIESSSGGKIRIRPVPLEKQSDAVSNYTPSGFGQGERSGYTGYTAVIRHRKNTRPVSGGFLSNFGDHGRLKNHYKGAVYETKRLSAA